MNTLCEPGPVADQNEFRRSSGRMVKVLHVVNGEHYAGAARVQDLLALALPDFGFDVSFASLLSGRFESQRMAQDSPLYHVPMKGRLDFRPVHRMVDLIRNERFDIVHSHTTRSAMVAAAAAACADVPYVHHVHCQMDTEVGFRVKTFVNKAIEKRACRRADRVIAVSSSIAGFLRKNRFTEAPVDVIPNGVPRDKVRPSRSADQPWVIGMVALLRERKGLESLLKAMPLIASEQRVRFRIVGPFESESYRNRMYDLSDSLGVSQLIDWTGYTNDVNAEICQMDALVLPSVLPEGMPMVLLEAIAAGVPILGSQVDGITDVIDHERNGLLFTAADHDSLALQLLRLMQGDVSWETVRDAGITDYERRYSHTVMARRVADVYSQLLSGRQNLS